MQLQRHCPYYYIVQKGKVPPSIKRRILINKKETKKKRYFCKLWGQPQFLQFIYGFWKLFLLPAMGRHVPCFKWSIQNDKNKTVRINAPNSDDSAPHIPTSFITKKRKIKILDLSLTFLGHHKCTLSYSTGSNRELHFLSIQFYIL